MRRSRRLDGGAAMGGPTATASPTSISSAGWRKWLPVVGSRRVATGSGGDSSSGVGGGGGSSGSSSGGRAAAAAAAAGGIAATIDEATAATDAAYEAWAAVPPSSAGGGGGGFPLLAVRPRGGGLAASRSVPHMTEESLTRLLAGSSVGGGNAANVSRGGGGGGKAASRSAKAAKAAKVAAATPAAAVTTPAAANAGSPPPPSAGADRNGDWRHGNSHHLHSRPGARVSVDAGGFGSSTGGGGGSMGAGVGGRVGGRGRGANRGARATVDLGSAVAAPPSGGSGVGGEPGVVPGTMGGVRAGAGGAAAGVHPGVSGGRPGFGGRLSAFRHRNFGGGAAAAAAAASGAPAGVARMQRAPRRRASNYRSGGGLGGLGAGGGAAGGGGDPVLGPGGRMRQPPATASAGSGAGGDVGKREAYRSGYDPLALLRRLPASVASAVEVRVSGSRWLVHSWTPHWAELRGRLVVLLDPEAPGWEGMGADVAAGGGALGVGAAGGGGVGDAAVRALFSTHRLFVSRHGRGGTTLRLRRAAGAASSSVWLRFLDDATAGAWEKALVQASASRVVGVSDFVFVAPIGKGASGKVFLVRDRVTGERLALKVIDKRKVFDTRSGFRHAVDERLALQLTAGHPFFTQLRYAFQTRTNLYVALAFCDGGDLFQYLRTHGGRLREPQLRLVAAEVLLALEELHALGFVYRDLKPENVLLDRDGHVRLADFGLCKQLRNQLTSTICGTHTYAAPETLSGMAYNTSIDCWALGIFLYHLLRGRTPYEAPTLEQVIHKMSHSPVKFPSSTSPELTALITGLLDFKPANRLGCGLGGVSSLRSHPFFAGVDWEAVRRGAPHADALSTKAPPPGGIAAAAPSAQPLKSLAPPPVARSRRRRVHSAGGGGDDADGRAPPADAATPDGMQDELRNFDLAEWGHVSIDNDRDDATYGDDTLWPPVRARKRIADELFVVGFAYASPRPGGAPPGRPAGGGGYGVGV
ncbi:hypothetical protein I4F81_011064 [Pyropia yezoensis]|uniref:Uncharacterized protein n=1 Tax=Pyropia yezoensis TaxID=2788 RepID=A0ACC3CE82_PYRYE|nr:hypothetical protein I4F81_011064 [Neopyropia yezoensis]